MPISKLVVLSANTSWYLYNFRKNTIKALIREGYSVATVSPADNYVPLLLSLGCSHHSIRIDRAGKNPLKDFITFLLYVYMYLKLKPCSVLNFTPKVNIYSSFACALLNIKYINNIAGLGTMFVSQSIFSRLVIFLYKISHKSATHIFFQNDEDQSEFEKLKIVNKGMSYSRLPGSGVDLEHYSVVQAPDDGVVRFALVARLLPEKGIAVYADAARIIKDKYPNTEFHLFGPIDKNNPSAIDSEQLDLWVGSRLIHYHGMVDDIGERLANIDCVVLPSFYREGVPRSLLEAAAMGKPLITTDNVGCRDVVCDGYNGFLCKVRSKDSLAEKMIMMIEQGHDNRKQMGEASRLLVEEKFDENIVIGVYIDKLKPIGEASD